MTFHDGDIPARVLRQGFACFPTGVTVLCAMLAGGPIGIAASSFTPVSLEPPLVSVCLARKSTTWPKLRTLRRIGLSVLAEHHGPVARSLGAASSTHRFTSVDWEHTDTGAVFVRDCGLRLETTLFDEVEAGDHIIALLRVMRMSTSTAVSPLIYYGSSFRRLDRTERPGVTSSCGA